MSVSTLILIASTLVLCQVAGAVETHPIGSLQSLATAHPDLTVWSKDEFTGETGWRRPVTWFATHPAELHHLSYDVDGERWSDETLSGTAPHPFWLEAQRKFVPMGELKPGDVVTTANGGSATITANLRERAPPGETFTTYNFEVAEFHTYFVGAAGVWVHNNGPADCQRLASLFDRILDFKNYQGNLGKAYDDITRRLGKSLAQDLKSTFVEGLLDDLPRLKDAGKIDPRIVAFATEDGLFKPAEAFLGSRFELLAGRKITGRAPKRLDPMTGNQLPGADFLDDLGHLWDGVGPLPKSAWTDQNRLEGFYRQITRHIDLPEKGNPIVDLAGLPDSLKQRALDLVKSRLSDPSAIGTGTELLLDNGKRVILLGD